MSNTIGDRDTALHDFFRGYYGEGHEQGIALDAQELVQWMYERGWVFVPRTDNPKSAWPYCPGKSDPRCGLNRGGEPYCAYCGCGR